jgi:hypothetical protein
LHVAAPCEVSHTLLHPPQLLVVFVAVSQPFVSGAAVLQLPNPGLQLAYEHVVPSHVAPLLLVASHTLPQAPQFSVVFVWVSQPFVSGTAVLQLANPALQLPYEHVVPLQVAPLLLVVSHAFPQPPQSVVVLVGVSQPLTFGALVTQSANPPAHVYEHVVPLQVAVPCAVSQTFPHPPQLDVELRAVSQPLVFGTVLMQSSYPGLQLV